MVVLKTFNSALRQAPKVSSEAGSSPPLRGNGLADACAAAGCKALHQMRHLSLAHALHDMRPGAFDAMGAATLDARPICRPVLTGCGSAFSLPTFLDDVVSGGCPVAWPDGPSTLDFPAGGMVPAVRISVTHFS